MNNSWEEGDYYEQDGAYSEPEEISFKCEYCGCLIYKDESNRVKNDEGDYIEICDSCFEGCKE
jgi:hypothetical protein